MTKPHFVAEDNASLIWKWLNDRGGIVIWQSVDLSMPGQTWTGPFRNADGTCATKPHWRCGNEPLRHITDAAEVLVETVKEVKRFRVAIRRTGPLGMTIKCTDASSARIRREVEKAKERRADGEAWHMFDYETQEAVIVVPDKQVPIVDWIAKQVADATQQTPNPARQNE